MKFILAIFALFVAIFELASAQLRMGPMRPLIRVINKLIIAIIACLLLKIALKPSSDFKAFLNTI